MVLLLKHDSINIAHEDLDQNVCMAAREPRTVENGSKRRIIVY